MNKANIDAQEELAFDTMDEFLDKASWKLGTVIVKAPKTVFFCYDIPQVRKALKELALAAVKNKYKQCDANLDPVVQNIIDEYAHDFKRNRIFDRAQPRLKRAQ